MIIALFFAVAVGVLAGTFTGITPGIHINLIAFFLLSLLASEYFSGISPIIFVVFIVAMSITHTFIDFIPSILLGAPDLDTALSVLPGHKFLLKGRGYYAIVLTLYGSLVSLFIILFFTPLFIYFLPKIYPYILRIMPIILVLVSGYLIYHEKNKRLWAIIIFILAGFLGIASLNLNIKDPLLPLLAGLFGASNLVISIQQKIKIPRQKITPLKKIKLSKKSFFNGIFSSLIASPFTAFLPGLGASQAAVIGSEVTGDLDQREFLFLLGAINTIVMGLSFVTLYTIQKSRTGSAVAVAKLLPDISPQNIYVILGVIFISGILAFCLAIFLAKIFSKHISKIRYDKLSLRILIFLSFIILIFSGLLGILVFIISTFTGLTCIYLGVKRTHLMGVLLVPTILFYLF